MLRAWRRCRTAPWGRRRTRPGRSGYQPLKLTVPTVTPAPAALPWTMLLLIARTSEGPNSAWWRKTGRLSTPTTLSAWPRQDGRERPVPRSERCSRRACFTEVPSAAASSADGPATVTRKREECTTRKPSAAAQLRTASRWATAGWVLAKDAAVPWLRLSARLRVSAFCEAVWASVKLAVSSPGGCSRHGTRGADDPGLPSGRPAAEGINVNEPAARASAGSEGGRALHAACSWG